ncbi:MAG: sulfatase-like hydrolase/transferase [Desulfuromonadales bacterium]|jgi:arylsulfatase A-like enzyme
MEISRRKFIEFSSKASAAALLSRLVDVDTVFGDEEEGSPPNILLILVDQQQLPPAYGPDEGMVQGLKEILGFQPLSPDNPYTQYFPGFMRLREHAVVLRTHYTAAAACVPSRTCLLTGSYATGVRNTDGMFKSAHQVTWLDPDGVPTLGDWFRAAGYSTHYFGKWHVSHPPAPGSLEDWGFSDWESSYPEPHGGATANTGAYRDGAFADNVAGFLSGRAEEGSDRPWFAVGSLVNPHDLGTWPVPWQLPLPFQGVVPWTEYPPPPGIPAEGEQSCPKESPPGSGEEVQVDLNPEGFPQETCALPPTLEESLDDKPRCQYDYSLKAGLAFKAIQEVDVHTAGVAGFESAYPFQLQGENAPAWYRAYGQFYAYCLYLAELQLRKMLQALDDSGLAGNTIVVFLSDHGEMVGAHGGMIQKWHNAYEEAIRVPMVISSPLVNKKRWRMREIHQPTSSIDLAPTLLGLAGYGEKALRAEMEAFHGESAVKSLVGADLSSHVRGETEGDIHGPDGKRRTGVFFLTEDMISELGSNPDLRAQAQYGAFLKNVEMAKEAGYPLASGSVRQPNNVRALCTGDWKIVRYVDPHGQEPDEWELYCLRADPTEHTNLVDFATGEVRDDVSVPGLKRNELRQMNKRLQRELARQEAAMLGDAG